MSDDIEARLAAGVIDCGRTSGVCQLKRRRVDFGWDNLDTQAVFAEWAGFPDARATAREVDQIERLLSLRPTDRVLDVGCGTGRHAVELAIRGYRVVGIDIAETYLREAERAAEQANVSIEFRLQRASKIEETACYDVAIAINHTLGVVDESELVSQFKRIAKSLRPGGNLLLKTAGPQCIPGHDFEAKKDWGEKDGRFILSEKRLDGRVRIEDCIVIDMAKEEIVEIHEEQTAFTLDDVVQLLRSAGFTAINCLKDLAGNESSGTEFGVYVCNTYSLHGVELSQ